jgi:hypothetical protein
VVRLIVGVVVGVVVYSVCLLAFKVEEIDALRDRLRDRLRGGRSVESTDR